MVLPSAVLVREVGPRDGLQSLPEYIPAPQKVALINALAETGLRYIEAVSFVHPKRVPQMRDAEEVMAGVQKRPGVRYGAFVPNLTGLERAIKAGVDEAGVGLGASDTFNVKNVNRTAAERFAELQPFIARAREVGVAVDVGTVAMAFVCPFEGAIPPARVLEQARRLASLGIGTISLADTVGAATPRQVYEAFTLLRRELPDVRLGAHLHDTRGTGLANALAALEAGVTVFDSSIGGLGGCPFAPGASGNISTEDLVYMLEGMGIETGVDLDRLRGCGRLASEILGRELPSHVLKAGRLQQVQAMPAAAL
ncbi:MAG: hydroxymethylglutaryl-CoA lyase [Deltaproteobacteria bacterium]|nr:hydroxymethylglutaryl-CoA lyase [Deltaproteobacteria bacterium]